MNIYSIYDSVVKAYQTHFFLVNRGHAIRSVSDLFRSDNEISRNPQDYILYQLGEYNEQSGQIKSFESPEKICHINELDPNSKS